MTDAGFIEVGDAPTKYGKDIIVHKMTKKGITDAGGFSVDLLKALANGFLNKKLEKATGVDIDI